MEAIERLLAWAKSNDVIIDGIEPRELPGRGIGLVASRDIEANQDVLTVPTAVLRTLESTPRPIVQRLKGARVHAILAAALCLETDPAFDSWRAVLPSEAAISSCMPLNWAPALQALLPPRAQSLLSQQRAKFEQDWSRVSAAYPAAQQQQQKRRRSSSSGNGSGSGSGSDSGISRSSFLYAWHLVNSRSFYHTTKKTEKLPHEDHLVLQPVADLFNHAPDHAPGCKAAFDQASFTITTTRRYAAGEELLIRYGAHSNDALLVEYGFTLDENPCDEVCLDPWLCPLLVEGGKRKTWLEEAGFWENYMLDQDTACYRTQTALRALCLEHEQWRAVLDGERDEDEDRDAADKILLQVLRRCEKDIRGKIREVDRCTEGTESLRRSLRRRWLQMKALVVMTVSRLS